MRHELSSDNTLIIRGPAAITLLSGHATVLGAPTYQNQRIGVQAHRQLPLETESTAEFEITYGKTGKIFEVQGSTIPESWRQAAAALGEIQDGKVIILGATDVGKSTLCTYLANNLMHANGKVCVVDADVGQADLGPPTAIARATATRPVTSLSQLTTERRLFVGHTSPAFVEREIIRDIQRLCADAKRSLTIINTDGWVAEPAAVQYKIRLITDINPNLVLGITYREELLPILGSIRSPSMKVDVSKEVLERSRTDRRKIRAEGYRKALKGATTYRIPLRSVKIFSPTSSLAMAAQNRNCLRSRIIGLLDESGYLLQLGIVRDIESETLRVYCRPAPTVRRIQLGYVRLSMSGREIGFL